jgi:hypothetical protein
VLALTHLLRQLLLLLGLQELGVLRLRAQHGLGQRAKQDDALHATQQAGNQATRVRLAPTKTKSVA